MAVKPIADPKWSVSNNPADNIEPTPSLKNGGVPAGGVWGREFLNWQFYAISQWIDWVRSSALDKDNNLSDLTNTATARTNLGLNNTAVTLGANAATATKLATARTINGTSFDGSANITTASWGTARTLTIGNTGKSVNGAANVSWSLAEIGVVSASDTTQGIVRLATTAEARALASATLALTPARLADAFKGENQSLVGNGYQKLPGGLVIQWGKTASIPDGGSTIVTFPVAFPTGALSVSVTGDKITTSAHAAHLAVTSLSATQMKVEYNGTVSQPSAGYWIAIGY